MNQGTGSTIWAPDILNRRLQGRYEILRELGEGAAGTVFLARDLRLDRLVALKTILDPSEVTPAQLARFRYEIQLAATMSHPNIVRIHELLEIEGRPICVMEYIEGQTLQELPPESARDHTRLAKVFAQIARGLAYAHSSGIIHRDIKPGNLMLTADDVPKILDFGIAKRVVDAAPQAGDPKTQLGELIGTPPFMSPEQVAGDSSLITDRTDLYSLGATLYFCLTRRLPHTGRTAMEIVHRVVADPVRLPTAIDPTIPRDLEAICLKAMEKESANRYPSALALAEDLENFLQRRPITARQYDFREKLVRAIRHHREAFLVSVILIALMCAGLMIAQFAQFNVARQSLIDNLRGTLEGIAATAALTISADAVARIHGPEDRGSTEFIEMVATLKKVRMQNPRIIYVYVMRESVVAPGKLEFVAECDMLDTLAELDDDGNGVLEGLEIPSDVGDIYQDTADYPAMREGLQRIASDPDTAIIDEYGVSLSGYAPVRNRAGESVAVLGVDMKNDKVVETLRRIRYAFFGGLAFTAVLTLTLLGVVANWLVALWMRPGRS